MIARFALLLLSLVVTCAPANGQKAKQKLPLYICLGQSNMVGLTGGVWYLFPKSTDREGKPVKHMFQQKDLMMWSATREGTGDKATIKSWSFEPYQASWWQDKDGNANTELAGMQGKTGNNLSGPEAALGVELVKMHGKKVYMIKIAMVSSLGHPEKDSVDTFPEWNKSADQLYARLLKRVRAAQKLVAPDILEPKAIFWMQGSTDAASKKPRKEYKNNLLRFAKNLRKDLKSPKLPFIVARLHNGYDKGKPSAKSAWQRKIDVVRKAQVAAAKKDRYMVWLDTDKIKRAKDRTPPDWFHFDSPGVIELGRAFFKLYVDKFPSAKK